MKSGHEYEKWAQIWTVGTNMKSEHKYEKWAQIWKVGTNMKIGHTYEKDDHGQRFWELRTKPATF